MATISKKQAEQPQTPLNLEELFTREPSQEDLSIDNLLTEFASVELAEVRVYRVLPTNKLSYIYACHPSEFRFDDLRDTYKGGKFRVFVYGIDDDNKKVLKSAQQFEVEKVIEVAQAKEIVNNDITMLAQTMIAGFQRLGEMLVQTQNAQQLQHVDPDEAEAKFMQKMVIMKQLFGNNQTPQHQENPDILTKSLDMLTKGIEMGKSLSPTPLGESSTTDVLLETIKNFAPVMMASMQAKNTQVPIQQTGHVQQVPQIPPIPKAEINPIESAPEMNIIQRTKLQMGLGFLVDAAQRNLHVPTYAEIALDTLSDDELNEIFTHENPVEFFTQFEPRIADNKAWFEMLMFDIKSMLTDDGENVTNEVIQTSPETALNATKSSKPIIGDSEGDASKHTGG